MTKNVCRFDMSYFATPKSEEDKKTLSEHGYRTLKGEEALECVKGLESLTVGDVKIETLPVLLSQGIVELRYYKRRAQGIGKEKGNDIFICFKDGGELLPIGLRER